MTATAPIQTEPNSEVIVFAPLSLEARAVRSGAPWAVSTRSGWGLDVRPGPRSSPATPAAPR